MGVYHLSVIQASPLLTALVAASLTFLITYLPKSRYHFPEIRQFNEYFSGRNQESGLQLLRFFEKLEIFPKNYVRRRAY